MVVLISSTVTICNVKPKLEDGNFRVSRLIHRPEVPFFSGKFHLPEIRFKFLVFVMDI